MYGHDRHNTTVLSIIHNMSTTCFGQKYFWPSSGSPVLTPTLMIILYHIIYCVVFSDNSNQPDDGQN